MYFEQPQVTPFVKSRQNLNLLGVNGHVLLKLYETYLC